MKTSLKVLHVEDSERDVALLTRHLAQAGYELISERVETPEAMKAALEAKEWDIILCDYSMPHFSALAALNLLKGTGLDIPFIIISGTVGEDVAVEAMRAGASDYLLKDNLVRLVPTVEREIHEAENRCARRQAEAELLKSEAQYRRLIDTAYEGIWMADARAHITYANQRLAEMLGYSVEEMIGRSAFEALHESDREEMKIRWQRRLQGIKEQYDLRLRRKDGSDLWVIFSATPIRDERGEVTGALAMLTDITERRRLEEQLRQSQKMEAVGQLAGGIAHDFNNLLTAITGYSELTMRRLKAEDPLRQNIEEIKKAGDRAAALTRQLLAFSRKQVLQPKILDLNAVVSELEKMLRRLIGEDIGLRTVLGSELGSIKADPSQIEQVLMNLAVNARDAMPQGGKLTIETKNVYLNEEYARQHISVTPGHYVMLAVSDSGTGMDAKTQARIFEPFFTTKEAGKGTGLGLSTVYGIVKQSGGNIWVYSEVGRGTTFKVYLPRVDEGAEEFKRSAETKEVIQGAETILLAEDEEMVRKLARQVLEMYGYQVLEAANGGAALLICERHTEPIHLLITDVIMPEMSGRELADRLARLRPEMKVLYMSGYTDNAIVHQGVLDEGANFIQKPFSTEALARKVRELLDAPRKT